MNQHRAFYAHPSAQDRKVRVADVNRAVDPTYIPQLSMRSLFAQFNVSVCSVKAPIISGERSNRPSSRKCTESAISVEGQPRKLSADELQDIAQGVPEKRNALERRANEMTVGGCKASAERSAELAVLQILHDTP